MDQKIRKGVLDLAVYNLRATPEDRRKTFINWPVGFISPDELVAEGLFYLRVEDCCMCVFCRKTFNGWKEGCSVKEKHYKISPDCFNLVMKCKAINFWNPERLYVNPYEIRDRDAVFLFTSRFRKYCQRVLIDNTNDK